MPCPACRKGVLHRHDSHDKTVMDLNGKPLTVTVQRLKCSSCGEKQSCMPHPLLPYKRHTVQTLMGMIDDYIRIEGSYYEISSGAAPDYGKHSHVLFCALERLLDFVSWIEEWLQRVRFGQGESMWRATKVKTEECPNAWKARKTGKKEKLNRARAAMELMNRLMKKECFEVSFSEEAERAAGQLTAPFSILTSARVRRWFIPHKREFALL